MRFSQFPGLFLGCVSGVITLMVLSIITIDHWGDPTHWLNSVMAAGIVAMVTGLLSTQQNNQSQMEFRRLKRTLNHWLMQKDTNGQTDRTTQSNQLAEPKNKAFAAATQVSKESGLQHNTSRLTSHLFEQINQIEQKASTLLEEQGTFSRKFDRLNSELSQFAKLLNHLPIPVFFFNKQVETIFINQSGWRVFGEAGCTPLPMDAYPLHLNEIDIIHDMKQKLTQLCQSYLQKPIAEGQTSGQTEFSCHSNQKMLGLGPNTSSFDLYWIKLDQDGSDIGNDKQQSENAKTTGTSDNMAAHLAVMAFPRFSEDVQKEAQAHFASLISHEMRTPLSSIKAYLEMLLDNEVESEAQKHAFYSIVQSEANRLDGLIDNLLTLYRLEAGILTGGNEKLDFNEIVEDVIENLQALARSKRLTIKREITPSPMFVCGDRNLLRRAIYNLLENAIQYSNEVSTITITLGEDQNSSPDTLTAHENKASPPSLLFTIEDSGTGIPQAELAEIFKKFYRIDNHRHRSRGTGLGLSLVKDVVEKVHEGKVWAESEEDKGSLFHIQLPLASYQPLPEAASNDEDEAPLLEEVER